MGKKIYKAIMIQEDDISYTFKMLDERKSKEFNGWYKNANVRIAKKDMHGLFTKNSIEFLYYIIDFKED